MGGGAEHACTLGSRYKLTSPLFLPPGRPLSSVPHQATPGVSTGSWAPTTPFRGPPSSAETPHFSQVSNGNITYRGLSARSPDPLRLTSLEAAVSHWSSTTFLQERHQTLCGHASFSAPAPPFKYPQWPISEKA